MLGAAPVVIFDRHDDLQDDFLRKLVPRRVPGAVRHYVPASEAYLEAVAAGLGWGMIPDLQAAARRASGALVDLAPDRPVDVPLYWQQWKLDSPALAALADAVARTASLALPGRA